MQIWIMLTSVTVKCLLPTFSALKPLSNTTSYSSDILWYCNQKTVARGSVFFPPSLQDVPHLIQKLVKSSGDFEFVRFK